jgi:uncharacterized zinc-type alcohol dehydrogenase-like protein
MIQVNGFAVEKAKAPLAPYSFQRRAPSDHDVVIDIKYCGICHTDLHQVGNEWGGSQFPLVPGHEITGIVSQVGHKVMKHNVGDKVGVGYFVDSCRKCEPCNNNLEQFCIEGVTATCTGIERGSKTPSQGGYSNKIVVDENYVLKIPENLPLDKAAPLLCAGITLYSPLVHWKAGPGKRVAIIGLGGIGHMGVKIAHALGAEVTVLSHSLKKQEDGKKLGADYFYATSDDATFQKLKGYFDLIINTVTAEIDWNRYLELLKLDGTMVLVGVSEKQIPVGSFSLIAGRRSLAGSAVGGIKETQEMLNFCSKNGITSEIELIPIQKVNDAYKRVLNSEVRYRFVIDIKSLEEK